MFCHAHPLPLFFDSQATGPPHGILDWIPLNYGDHNLGCEELSKTVARVKLKLHIFGHIHAGYGKLEQEGTIFINASVMTEEYELVNKAIEIEI